MPWVQDAASALKWLQTRGVKTQFLEAPMVLNGTLTFWATRGVANFVIKAVNKQRE